MNERLVDRLLKSEVKKLPGHKRRLYQFIVDFEDSLVQEADTADEYLRLLTKHSPYAAASRHFKLSSAKIATLMGNIEEELSEQVKVRAEKVKWLDCTDRFTEAPSEKNRKHVFLFIS